MWLFIFLGIGVIINVLLMKFSSCPKDELHGKD